MYSIEALAVLVNPDHCFKKQVTKLSTVDFQLLLSPKVKSTHYLAQRSNSLEVKYPWILSTRDSKRPAFSYINLHFGLLKELVADFTKILTC